MKKLLSLLLLLTILVCSLASCGVNKKDNVNIKDEEKIIGKWEAKLKLD